MKDTHLITIEIAKTKQWFADFYSPQVEQAQRAARSKTEWSAQRDGVTYKTLSDLDKAANEKQEHIRELRKSLRRV